MNQLEITFQKLAEKEAALREEQRRRRHAKMAPWQNRGLHKLPTREALLKRLKSKTKQVGECVEWTAALNGYGYGSFHFGRESLAHRIMWLICRGEIPEGTCVLHKCDNPPCVNISHLFLGTHLDNMRDCFAKNRHPCTIVTLEQVMEIRIRSRQQLTNNGRVRSGFHNMISREYGITADYARHLSCGIKRP